MVCTNERVGDCTRGYDYGYKYSPPECCNYDSGMSNGWAIFLWIMFSLCCCLMCMMAMKSMQRRRMQQMQMMQAQQRNGMGNPNQM